MWLPDATVEYLSSKHIPLFVVAILILVIGTVYTCTIFFWQWLLHLQDKMIFKWIISRQLCHFIEPYHAPYVPKHRYWTGLLLFIRFALYLVFALNVSGDPGVNLLAIITSVVGLFIPRACARGKAIGLSVCRCRCRHENRQISCSRHLCEL